MVIIKESCYRYFLYADGTTVSGKLVKTIDRYSLCNGYRSDPIDWDGKDEYGDDIGRGVYIYRLKVRAADGDVAEKYEKLVILK